MFFFGRRKKYNGKVASLLPAFGFTLDDAGVLKTLSVLDIAWDQKYSEYEAALYVAYLVYAGMHKSGDGRTSDVKRQIDFIQKDWVANGLVRNELAFLFSSKTAKSLGVESEEVAKDAAFSFEPNMPDITKSKPFGAYRAPGYFMLLGEDAPTIAESLSGDSVPLKYPFVLTAMDLSNNRPCLFVTLEAGITDQVFVGVFDASGTHTNLGPGAEYTTREAFETAAVKIACTCLGLDIGSLEKQRENCA